jgi:23S rRNA (uridine2552-2'-O)-methyltransferase
MRSPLKTFIQNKKLKGSSRKWVTRQLKDPYVALAKKHGYRSRAAFKLLEINEKFKIFKKSDVVIDLGAAPGGWSQVLSKLCRKVVAVDLLPMDPLPNVEFFVGDFSDEDTTQKIESLLCEEKADVILSDMAPQTCGIKKVDHIRIMSLVEEVFEFSKMFLKEGGTLVVKVFQGGAEKDLLCNLKKNFEMVRHYKPSASRKESVEMYIVASNFLSALS